MDKIILSASPGVIEFSNFEKIKVQLSDYIESFDNRDYESLGYDFALADKDELAKVKKFFSKRRLGLKKVYTEPYIEVEAMFKELEAIIDAKLKPAKDYVDLADRDMKRKRIMNYAKNRALEFGEQGSKVIESPSFFNDRWLNKSYKQSSIVEEIGSKLEKSKEDIAYIKELPTKNRDVLLARYYETLSTDGLSDFNKNLDNITISEQAAIDDKQERKLRIRTTKLQYLRLLDFMNSEGIYCEEIN